MNKKEKELMQQCDKLALSKGYKIEIDMAQCGILSMVLNNILVRIQKEDFQDRNGCIKFIKIN